jgi:hypothetical protein
MGRQWRVGPYNAGDLVFFNIKSVSSILGRSPCYVCINRGAVCVVDGITDSLLDKELQHCFSAKL